MNCLHEALKSLEIWDEHISVILRFLDSHKLSRPGVQVLRSYIRVLVLLTRYRCLIGENRQDSTESSKNANLASQVVVMQFPSSSSILKIILYLPRHYKQEQQMATTEVQCNIIAYFFFTKQETFHRFDKDKSGDMNLYELRDALNHLGNNIY